MPPKGWRKNADGQYPQLYKEPELVSIDDILFPRSTVQKLAKGVTQSEDDNTILAKDSLVALQRSATVFVSHLLFHARAHSKSADRKTISAQDIISALELAEFNGFVPEVKQQLSAFEASLTLKKQQKELAKQNLPDHPAKKLKDSASEAVPVSEVVEVSEDEDEPVEEVVEMEEDEDDEPEVQEVPASNPIAILGQEEDELNNEIKEEQEEDLNVKEEDD